MSTNYLDNSIGLTSSNQNESNDQNTSSNESQKGTNHNSTNKPQYKAGSVNSNQQPRNVPNLPDNKITRDELRTVLKAMDQEGFDKLMEDYVKEISDPNNITETNQYLRECMERKDLPANIKLVQPTEGFVIKSSKYNIKKPGFRQKVFINLVGLKDISPPQIDAKTNMCSLPHLLNKPRNDQDKKGIICYTFDVAFNPDAIKRSEENMGFKKFLCDTAINGINNNILKSANEKISSDYVLKTKLKYKGKEISLMNVNTISQKDDIKNLLEPNEDYKTQIQKEIEDFKNRDSQKDAEVNEDEEDKIFDKPDVDYELSQKQIAESNLPLEAEVNIKPKYKIKYSDDVQLHKYFYNPNNFFADEQYSKLIVDLIVPKVDNLNYAEVELDEKKLHFKYKEIYLLDLDLPVAVDKNTSEAKFDRKRNLLSISALIVRKNKQELKLKEDENIEIVNSEDEKENSKAKEISNKESVSLDDSKDIKESQKKQEEEENFKKNKENANVNKSNEALNQNKVNNIDQKNIEKLEFDKNLKKPIELELKAKKDENVGENTSSNEKQEKKTNPVQLVKEINFSKNDEDDIESGISFSGKNNTDSEGFVNRSDNQGNEESAKVENTSVKKTFEKKEMAQLAFLNYNCPWIYELD